MNNRDKLGVDTEKITDFYTNEIDLLKKGVPFVPNPNMGQEPNQWNNDQRVKEAETLTNFLAIEKKVDEILKELKI
jgi:hypothetical protein